MFTKNKMVFDGEMPADGICCIYLLVCDIAGVVYVGQTTALKARIRQHANSEKKFDRFEYQPCHIDSANQMECENIVKYNPVFNTALPPNNSHVQITTLKKLLIAEFTEKVTNIISDAQITFDRSNGATNRYTYVSADILKEISGVIKSIKQGE